MSESLQDNVTESTIGLPLENDQQDSSLMWLLRGTMVGVLLMGAANAMSFFFRSSGWGSLLGNREPFDEAIGFPMLIWEEASGYGSHILRIDAFVTNALIAIVLGMVIGVVAVLNKSTLNEIMNRFRGQESGNQVRLQFSLRGLMVTTVLAALTAAAARTFTPRVEVLAAIYALGPVSLVILAFLPRRLTWQQRVTILAPAAFILIAVAITLGQVIDVEFDKVLMGIFICWTPQTAIAALVVTTVMMMKEHRAIRASS